MTKIHPLFLIIIILLLVGGVWFVWQRSDVNSTFPVSNSKIYRDDKFGFEFKYPDYLELQKVGAETRRSTPQLDEIYLSGFQPKLGQMWIIRLNIRDSSLSNIEDLKYNYQDWMPGDRIEILSRTKTAIANRDAIIEKIHNKRNPDSPEVWIHILNDQKIYTWLFVVTSTTTQAISKMEQTKNQILASFQFIK